MDVHLVTVEIGIVRVTEHKQCWQSVFDGSPIGVVHSNCLLAKENLDLVRHHTRLMQGRLSIENDNISISDMSVHLFVSWHGSSVSGVGIAVRRE